jgi:beta-phosphoglucomutase-like phosphatase (HAD superfamily)
LRYDAVFFDFDGVLADSEPLHHACWADVLAPVGVALDWDTYARNCIGVSDWAMLDFFVSLSGGRMTRDDLRPLYSVKQQIFRERAMATTLIPPPTVELVQSLNGVRRAVVT